MTLVELVYDATSAFPRSECFGLVTQMRRASVSVPSNIAEGAGRNSSREFAQFLGISCGSIAELQTQLELAVRLGFLAGDGDVIRQAARVGTLVRSLRLSMKNAT